ncbi:MAG: replication-relaxation family protein [Anaerolineae bacterium]|nr:replication-relaxation family protein [Anaerolineae bacterium]
MTSTSNQSPRRKRFKRTAPQREILLSTRDVAVLDTIQSFGGVMSTTQISIRHWPPDMKAKLRYWKLNWTEILWITQQFPATYLDQCLELLKFIRKIRRLQANPNRMTADYNRLRDYLLDVNQRDPAGFKELERLADQLAQMSLRDWLMKTIETNGPFPIAFINRPTIPSEYISSACLKRLRLLYDLKWLDKDEMIISSDQGRGQTLWYLSRQTRSYLASLRGVSVKALPWKQVGAYGHLHMNHRLAINDFRLAITLSAERLGYTMTQWLDENELHRTHSKQSLNLLSDPNDPDSKTIKRRLVPDSFFALDTGNQWFHFVEIDRATETLTYSDPGQDLNFWALKVRKYGEYFKNWYEQSYPEAQGKGRILVVTTSEVRLNNMAQVCRQVAGQAARRYWFTLFSRVKPRYDDYFSNAVLAESIWQQASNLEERRILVW